MNPTKNAFHLIASVTLALTMPLVSAGPQRVTVIADESRSATDQTTTYEATCPSGKYRFRFNRSAKRVEFEFEGPSRTTVDLSSTPFGATFLGKGLHGKFESTCPPGALRVYFYGLEPKEGAAMRPVTYRFKIASNGVITSDEGLDEVSIEVINGRFLPREE